jgi:hypothetical protein
MLATAGDLLVCVPGGQGVEVAAIRGGRLEASWTQRAGEPVARPQALEPGAEETPWDAEELLIVWRFLTRAARRGGWVASCSGELASRLGDRSAVERLAAGRPAPTPR